MLRTTTFCLLRADELQQPRKRRRLGSKVNTSVMSPELQFQAFAQRIKNRHRSWKPSISVCEWEGVSCEGKDPEIREVLWENMGLRGNVSWSFLPATVQRVYLENDIMALDRLRGTLVLSELPRGLRILHIECHSFSGKLQFTHAPPELRMFFADGNAFSGELDLTCLPSSLQELHLNRNQFTGEINLLALPSTLHILRLGDNDFCGTPDLTQLPESLANLWLQDCKFTGEVDLRQLPSSLMVLAIEGNQITFAEKYEPDVALDPRNTKGKYCYK
mmetsp:Transcript_20483/g.28284  ORF Transcript_20483/g.28284 Transcript_20483/m.28284 type:complete len:275 (+) Transcript_20483:53-877(+)